MEENSISIINRSNSQVIGEKASALPIKITTTFSWIRFVFFGFFLALVCGGIFVYTSQKQVISVDVAGKSEVFQIFEIK